MKSASRPGSAIFCAAFCKSSESCEDFSTTPMKSSSALRCSAFNSASCGPTKSASTSICARIKGLNCVTSLILKRSRPSKNTTMCPFGIRTILWIRAAVPVLCKSDALGSSMRGSSCVTTPISLVSPFSDPSSANELSRPAVNGNTAPGNSTMSRTGRTGSSLGIWIFSAIRNLAPLTQGKW